MTAFVGLASSVPASIRCAGIEKLSIAADVSRFFNVRLSPGDRVS